MSSKISQLPNAGALTGAEQLPAVQAAGNVKTTLLAHANFTASIPAGFNGFASVPFASGAELRSDYSHQAGLHFDGATDLSLAFYVDGDYRHLLGWRDYGVYIATGTFLGTLAGGDLSLENYSYLLWNYSPVLDYDGNVLDGYSNILLNRSAGQQGAIADATGAGDVVARVNDLLAALRNLGLIAT